MDKVDYIHRRKRRYMAQILTQFEDKVQRHVPAEEADEFKGFVRQKLHAMAVDIAGATTGPHDVEFNALGVELRDRVYPNGQPLRRENT